MTLEIQTIASGEQNSLSDFPEDDRAVVTCASLAEASFGAGAPADARAVRPKCAGATEFPRSYVT
eukprot:5817457-Pleurochrysis_carterae.AAC.1